LITEGQAAAIAQTIYPQIRAYVDANPEKYELFLKEWRKRNDDMKGNTND